MKNQPSKSTTLSHIINDYDTIIEFVLKTDVVEFDYKSINHSLEISAYQRTDATFYSKMVFNTVQKNDLIKMAEKLIELSSKIKE